MPTATPPDFATMSLDEVTRALAEQRLPPVESWHPDHCGDSDMRIAQDGTWFYRGSPITRPAMVRLFSTILRREPDGSYVLVTPGEKLDIAVEDAPFAAVEVNIEGCGRDRRLAFRLNTDELVVAGPGHDLSVTEGANGPRPIVHVRCSLDARLTRSVYYELVNLALDDPDQPPGLWSDGVFYPLGAV